MQINLKMDFNSQEMQEFYLSTQNDKGYNVAKSFDENNLDRSFELDAFLQSYQDFFLLTNLRDLIFVNDEDFDYFVNIFSNQRKISSRLSYSNSLRKKLGNLKNIRITDSTRECNLIDLNHDFSKYYEGLSSGMRYHIRKSQKIFDFQHVKNVDLFVDSYSILHNDLSNNLYSDRTWQALRRGLEVRSLVAFDIYNDESNFVGGSVFAVGPENAYYLNAAFDRIYFNSPVSHGMFFKAISHFRDLNMKNLLIDESDSDSFYSSKQLNIKIFKKRLTNMTLTFPTMIIQN